MEAELELQRGLWKQDEVGLTCSYGCSPKKCPPVSPESHTGRVRDPRSMRPKNTTPIKPYEFQILMLNRKSYKKVFFNSAKHKHTQINALLP